ncbi:MAG: FliH/SctL family protein [Pseudomonadota bacterium]|nr:FliH/SctL family protein [Pseudomonadota bacterium]
MPKFMFNTHFDEESEERIKAEATRQKEQAEEEAPPTFSLQELEDQKLIEFKRGVQEGKAEMLEAIERETANLLEIISSKVDDLQEKHKEWTDTINKDAVKLARVIIEKLAPRLLKGSEVQEIEDSIEEAFRFLSNEPKVLIRVSEQAKEPIRAQITRITSKAGFQGDVEVVGDQLIRGGDCSVTWDSGSLEKSLENTWTTIDSIIDKVLDEPKDSESRVNPNEAHQME